MSMTTEMSIRDICEILPLPTPAQPALPSVIAILGSFCEAGEGRGRGQGEPPLPGRPGEPGPAW